MKRIATLTFGLVLIASVSALDLYLALEAASLQTAREPQFYGRSVLFSYEFEGALPRGAGDDRRIHTVQAAFSHENYSRLHSFERNEYGVYVLIQDLSNQDLSIQDLGIPDSPREPAGIRYRLIVDGLWTVDPNNPRVVTDRWGVRVSKLLLPPPGRADQYPIVRETENVEFRFSAEAGQRVTIVGSFNGWDPFMTPMTETEPGVYERRLRLTPGEHLYYFMVNGLRIADPRNADQRWGADGMIVSVVQLP